MIVGFTELFDDDGIDEDEVDVEEDEDDVSSSIISLSDAISKMVHSIRMFCF